MSQGLVAYLIGGIVALLVLLDLGLVDVEADDGDVLGELDGDGHANVAEAYERELGVTCEQIFVKGCEHLKTSYSLEGCVEHLPEQTIGGVR